MPSVVQLTISFAFDRLLGGGVVRMELENAEGNLHGRSQAAFLLLQAFISSVR